MQTKTWLQGLLGTIVLLNFLFLVLMNQNHNQDSIHKRELATMDNAVDGVYRFNDPITAYQVLEKLDIFERVQVTEEELNRKYQRYHMSLIADNKYCEKHRAFVVNHPEVIFKQQNIITSLIHNSLLRYRVIPEIGNDIQSNIGNRMPKEFQGKSVFDLRVDVNNFFTFFGMYGDRALGHQYSCLSQSSNAIPGHDKLFRKDYISEGVVAYADGYKSRPQCFNSDKFFLETYILYHEKACKDFFKMFKSQAYQDLKEERGGIVYMRKIGVNVHQGMGVFPIDDREETKILEMYKDGELCGQLKSNNIIQYFVYNPLLLYGHKFDFRIYMLIASANPVIAYYYDGFLRVSLHEYTPKSKELGALLTNTALSKSAFSVAARNGTYKGMTEAELKDFHLWNFQRLENYLYDNNVVTDRNWLDNYLRPEFRKALAHLVRMSQDSFKKLSSVYHLFGMDFMLDANLNLWFIEANASPALEGFSAEMKTHVANMLKDHYEIIYGLLRSRMKRVIQYVNNIVKEGHVTRTNSGEILINDLDQRRAEFQRISSNYFESEFEPSPENKFQPIINENFNDERRYFNLIKEECF